MKTIHLSKNKWGCFELIKHALHGSDTYYHRSYTWNLAQDVHMIPKNWSIMPGIRCTLYNLIAFLYVRPKKAINYCEAAHYIDMRLQPRMQNNHWVNLNGLTLSSTPLLIKNKKRKKLFVKLIGRFSCLNPLNHVTRSQRSETFSPNLHGQGLHHPIWSYAYKANDSTISSEW